jgi:hypothetical protein
MDVKWSEVDPAELPDWIEHDDRVPLILAMSLYNYPLRELEGYKLVTVTPGDRVGVWYHEQLRHTIIGLRGTSITMRLQEDLSDDKVFILLFLTRVHESSSYIHYA